MADETISEAPAIESGAENDNAGILSVEDLANSFAERVEAEAEGKPTETEATEATEAEGAEAVEEEEDVLSKSISQDDDEQEGEAEEEPEEEESSEEETEAESPAVGRLLKQIGKLTARAKGSEEQVEAMKAEIAGLKTQPAEAKAPGSPVLEDVGSLEDLEKVRQEALSAKKWALSHIGKDYVETDGREYDGDQIRDIFAAADEFLSEKIPARSQFLQQRQQWRTDARTTFPWLDAKEGELYELYLQIRGDGQYGPILDALANGDFVGATLARGVKATQDEQAAKGKPKKKSARAKPPPSQEGDVAPPVQSKKARQQARKNKALGKGVLSEGQLAAYLT